MLEEALKLAALGWYVFPCHTPIKKKGYSCSCEAYMRSDKNRQRLEARGKGHQFDPDYQCPKPGKHPRTFNGLDDASNDPEQIRKWWGKWPNANIGVNCGMSGILMVDRDSYKDNYRGQDLELDENTVTAISGGGGGHLYYCMEPDDPFGNSTKGLPAGVDIRGHGGLVIAAPSLHESGNLYQWELDYSPWDIPLAPIPPLLREILETRHNRSQGHALRFDTTKKYNGTGASAYGEKALESECAKVADAAAGGRNNTLNSAAFSIGQLVAGGEIDHDYAFGKLLEAAITAGLSDAEAERTTESGMESGMEHPKSSKPLGEDDAEVEDTWKVMDCPDPVLLRALVIPEGASGDALQLWAIENAQRLARLGKADLAKIKLTLTQRGVRKRFVDQELPAILKDSAQEAPEQTRQEIERYQLVGGRICRCNFAVNDDGEGEVVAKPLCNFFAQIVADVSKDDGEEVTHHMTINGRLEDGQELPDITISASDYEQMKWVIANWGARAAIEPGKDTRDALRHAIQYLSRDQIKQRRVYTHTGWREIDGKRIFLHAGEMDSVSVELEGNLKRYELPTDSEIDTVTAMRESIALLDIAKPQVSYPLWAAMFLAPLSSFISPAFLVWVEGPSGSFKSSYTTLLLNHYGRTFDENHTPADWISTPNSLEKMTFLAKDVPFLIDDFRPATNRHENEEMHKAAQRIIRSVGNRAGRGRLGSDTSFRRTFEPRGVVLSTAERGALGTSTVARIQTVTVGHGDINGERLAAAQKQRHVYGYAMTGYLQHIAEHWEKLNKSLPIKVIDSRGATDLSHKRLPGAMAMLQAAFDLAMEYAVSIGAITQEDADTRMGECYAALRNIALAQSALVEEQDPARIFVTILINLLRQGKAHLQKKDPGESIAAAGFGAELGERLGWYDGEIAYLLPAAYNAVYRYIASEGWAFPSDERTLRRDMDRLGYIADKDEGRLNIRKRDPTAPSTRPWVTVVWVEKILAAAEQMGIDQDDLYYERRRILPM